MMASPRRARGLAALLLAVVLLLAVWLQPVAAYYTYTQAVSHIAANGGSAGSVVLPGDLHIEYMDDIDLTALSGLVGVEGYLYIGNCDQLKMLNGLEQLKSIDGNLILRDNEQLFDVTALAQLKAVPDALDISNCAALESLRGFDGVEYVGAYLNLQDNPALSDITALSCVTTVETWLQIINCAVLESLHGLDGIVYVGDALNLAYNPLLTDITALSNVTMVESWLQIYDCDSLETLYGLHNVTSVGEDLLVIENESLLQLRLDSLGHIAGDVLVFDNPVLCCDADALIERWGANNPAFNYISCPGSDFDADDDGWCDGLDECPTDTSKQAAGVCGCGVADTDADSDGFCDTNGDDACPTDTNKQAPGVCDCGEVDTDADSDSFCDTNGDDDCPEDPLKQADGACGCGELDDLDDGDGDGVIDCRDPCPADNPDDSDGDTVCDSEDTCPNDDPDDTDADGKCDSTDICPEDPLDQCDAATAPCTGSDVDSDGMCDVDDPCPNDANNDLDGDGQCDDVDDCPLDKPDDVDGDGVCTSDDACPLDNPDDSDSDGKCDSDDECPLDAAKVLEGVCGCGLAEADVDSDGFCDANGDDECADDSLKQAPGVCGCGIADSDADADGLADCVDDCALLAPCPVGAVCYDRASGDGAAYICVCPDGFSGDLCRCSDDQCGADGVCVDNGVDDPHCSCKSGFSGDACEITSNDGESPSSNLAVIGIVAGAAAGVCCFLIMGGIALRRRSSKATNEPKAPAFSDSRNLSGLMMTEIGGSAVSFLSPTPFPASVRNSRLDLVMDDDMGSAASIHFPTPFAAGAGAGSAMTAMTVNSIYTYADVLEYDDLADGEVVLYAGEEDTAGAAVDSPYLNLDTVRLLAAIKASPYHLSHSELDVQKTIGKGSFGVVKYGRYKGNAVAIKYIEADPHKFDMKRITRDFCREALISSNIPPHPNIVKVHGISLEPLALVLEFLSGGDLQTLAYNIDNKYGIAYVVDMMIQIGEGVAHLHDQGIVHRDIAARNVLLSSSRDSAVPKLADFGMSRENQSDALAAGQTAAAVGPVLWMAPESIAEQRYSKRSDTWSYGVTFLELFDRGMPWGGRGALQVAMAVAGGEKPAIGAGVPTVFARLLDKCFELQPYDRPSMRDVVAYLKQVQQMRLQRRQSVRR